MKNIITSLLLIATISTFAQTGIGTTTPNTNAQLEVASTTKGFLPPRVALTSTTSASPIAAHVAGMVVYNTATAGDVTPGLYVNSGTAWVKSTGGASALNDLTDSKTGDYSSNNSVYLGRYTGESASTASTGDNNFAIGYNTLIKSSGFGNIAVGALTLQSNTSGSLNIGIGGSSLLANVGGNSNTAIGSGTLNYNSSGSDNTAIGTNALLKSLGNSNTAAGKLSLGNLSTGDQNVALGLGAGFYYNNPGTGNLTNASNSVFIGYASSPKNNNTTNEIAIGYSTFGNGPNTVTMGNGSITGAYIKVAWTVTSDMRDKNNFAPLNRGLEFINKLKPISFEFRKSRNTEETDGIKRFGFKAQDIEAIENGDFVIVDNKDAAHLKIKETYIIPILVKGMQEQQNEIDAVKKELRDLKALLKVKGLLD